MKTRSTHIGSRHYRRRLIDWPFIAGLVFFAMTCFSAGILFAALLIEGAR